MPITPSARKKMRQDKKRRLVNLRVLGRFKRILSVTRKNPTSENIQKANSIIDQVAKKEIIHKNKAARLKSRLIKLLKKITPEKPMKKSTKEKRGREKP